METSVNLENIETMKYQNPETKKPFKMLKHTNIETLNHRNVKMLKILMPRFIETLIC